MRCLARPGKRRPPIATAVAFAAAAVAAAAGCRSSGSAAEHPPLSLSVVTTLAAEHDYFALRDSLAGRPAESTVAALVARSLTHHAFNRLEASTAAIDSAMAGGVSDSLRFELGNLKATNLLRTFRYRDGLAAADSTLAHAGPAVDSAEIRDLANLRRILAALEAVPEQTVARRESTTVALDGGRLPVTIEGRNRTYLFDTGANLSVLSRGEAARLGLTVIDADIDVGSSTDIRNTADLAVANVLAIGNLEFRHVVFLVFDDRLLTFPGMTIDGIVGFPVIEAMGEVRLGTAGTLTVPAPAPRRAAANLALDGLTPLARVTWRDQSLVCRLDTGANSTQFYEPFYRPRATWIDSAGTADSTQTGGVGGLRTLPVRLVRDFGLGVGDTTFTLEQAEILTRSITDRPAANFLDCNLGHDIFDRFGALIMNFEDMAFLLR
ncbi:MAG: retropepsin-like aspartic protease [Gemmatimonadales bacterium]